MKNSFSTVKNKIISRYSSGNLEPVKRKSTNINVLLNRVRVDQKKEKIKKILFTASASLGLLIFGIFIF